MTEGTSFGMGVGPQNLQVGDRICVAFDSRVPFVIRDVGVKKCKLAQKIVINENVENRTMTHSTLEKVC